MGIPKPPGPALLLAAIFSRHDEALTWARDRVLTYWGQIVLESQKFSFKETTYYEDDMGAELIKQFLIVEGPFDPQELAERKLESNRWEQQCAELEIYPEKRPLNIDPGYITPTKLVLASTKDRSHRIYLASGIYAEETLYFHERRWQARPWTYADYQREDFQDFFIKARGVLKLDNHKSHGRDQRS